jgi:hypothetical protein
MKLGADSVGSLSSGPAQPVRALRHPDAKVELAMRGSSTLFAQRGTRRQLPSHVRE